MSNYGFHVTAENHPHWKGDEVGYKSLHQWVYRKLGKPLICEKCESTKNVEWANKSGDYKRDLSDWLKLCRFCHRKHDMKPTCRKGHAYTHENIYTCPRGYRTCRACKNEAWMKNYWRKKELKNENSN